MPPHYPWPIATNPQILARQIVQRCRDLGFALAGVCPAAPSDWKNQVLQWLGAGKHGDMEWYTDQLDRRFDPALELPGVRSVIMVADQYSPRGDDPSPPPHQAARPAGRIARYARGRDYHPTIKKRLHALADSLRPDHPGHKFRSFVDTAPVLEREHALRAGLGWIGKNTLLMHPQRGSYLLLGGIYTTLELAPPPQQQVEPDRCGSCTRCIDACPTRAIGPDGVDGSRCISYLTIEHQSPIQPELYSAIGDWIFGCDICQEVCPHNSPRPIAEAAETAIHPAYSPRRTGLDLLEVLGWSIQQRREALTVSSMKRATLAMFKRNALIVAGNALRTRPCPELTDRIRTLADDQNEPMLVRQTAAHVLASLSAGKHAPL